ncbi:MAG: lysoplasmalogenase [Chitinophagia bacterium]|jgi:uncharacterized membrane protein YhhN|nr:lysoplasmalogenase [Chitinophagia bacterium]
MKSFFTKWGLTLSLVIISIHFIAQFLGEEYKVVEAISKAIFLPSLMMYLYVQPNVSNKPGKNLVMMGLCGSFLGDVFLISKSLFIPGMIAFMMTHIINISFFNKINGFNQPKSNLLKTTTIILVGFCVFIYFQLSGGMGKLIYPILVYMILICSAALMAVHVASNKGTKIIANNFWIPGMFFFLTSDSILAFNKFNWSINDPIENIGLVIMITYGLAQFLLVKGFQIYFTTKSIDA